MKERTDKRIYRQTDIQTRKHNAHKWGIKMNIEDTNKTSETASYCSLMIPPPQVDNINNVKICKCSVNRKLSSDESEKASHSIADLYKS